MIDEAEAAREVSTGNKVPSLSREIRLEQVSFRYDKRPILQDVSMLVPAGEITVLSLVM